MRGVRLLLRPTLLALLPLAAGCGSMSYYAQAVGGHLALMWEREPVEAVLERADTPPALRVRLETMLAARRYAFEDLALPESDSYTSYVATGREYVTWNVVAAPEFSLAPRTWCFPVAGCVAYRGYFDRADAERFAATLADEGLDVSLGGATAYSTLGWFEDPVLDTMLRGEPSRWVGTLFHELAHQRLYVSDDSDFNEAFATTVEREGVRRWLASRGDEAALDAYAAGLARSDAFVELLGRTRRRLERLYAAPLTDVPAMRRRKVRIFERMREDYAALRERWEGYAGYDRWFGQALNNARLVSVATYRRQVPAFEALLDTEGGDLGRFYESAAAIGALPPGERAEKLASLKRGRAQAL